MSVGEPDAVGVYVASVVGWHPDGHVVFKDVPEHSMFPDGWTEEWTCGQVLDAHKTAMQGGQSPNSWRAVSESGVRIQGFSHHGKIIGYPVREEGQ